MKNKLAILFGGQKLWLWVSIVVVIIIITVAIFWLSVIREPGIKQPVMLRVLAGDVETRALLQRDLVLTNDGAWLNEGTSIKANRDSLAVLQFFDGSVVKIEGPAEVELMQSRSLKTDSSPEGRIIRLSVIRGRIIVAAVKLESSVAGSLFEVRTENSVGMVQGTVFEVIVDEYGGTSWEGGGDTVRVGAVTMNRDLRAVVALIPLNPGHYVKVSELPIEWREDNKRLITTAAEIAQKSIKEGSSDVQVGGTSQLAFNPQTDTAVFRVEEVTKLAATAVSIPQLPPGYEIIADKVLTDEAIGVALARAPLIKKMYVPSLPLPEVWATPKQEVLRINPPTYIFSIFDVAKPLGVTVSPGGQRIAVTEGGGEHVTRIFNRGGEEIMVLAPPGTVAAGRAPAYVAIDRMGTIYVSDRMRRTIDMYDFNGAYLGVFTPQNNPDISWSPLGLALESDGNLYLTDVNEQRIMVFDSSGELKLEFGEAGSGEGELSFPNDIALDSSGRIYVSDSNNFRVQVFDPQGRYLGWFNWVEGVVIEFPRGIEIEGDYLYVVDTFGHMVHVYNIGQGIKPVFTIGEWGVGDGDFNFPNDLAIDSTGRLYITDRENNRVQVWGY